MDKSSVWRTFDAIAPSYDKANRILSFGIDVLWRKKVKSFVPKQDNLLLLDLATGTGDLLAELIQLPRIKHATGIDMSEKMLDVARAKYQSLIMRGKAVFQRADALQLPFDDSSFDVATMAFGVRNVAEPKQCLQEIHRVLHVGGRAIILEFSLPRSLLLRKAYLLYFRHILPRLGGFIAGNTPAYTYLNSSVEAFIYGKEFADLMKNCGFSNVQCHELSGGIATIYVGEKVF